MCRRSASSRSRRRARRRAPAPDAGVRSSAVTGTSSVGPVRQDHRALDQVLQLADVARPVVPRQRIHRLGRDRLDRSSSSGARTAARSAAPASGCPRAARAAAARVIGNDVQPVEEVLAELLLVGERRQVAVGRRDQARIGAQRARAAQPLELALLQHAQQLRLQLERDLADFVEEHGAAVGQLEAADALADRAGERALLVAEQLALEQPGRDRRAIQLDEGADRGARSADESRARPAPCPSRSRRRSAPSNRLAPRSRSPCSTRPSALAAADDLLELVVAADLVFEVELLARQLRVQLLDALVRERVAHGDRDLPGHARQQRELIRRERIRRRTRRGSSVPRLPCARRQRHRAGRPDAARADEGALRKRLEIRQREDPRLAGPEHVARRRPVERALRRHRHVGRSRQKSSGASHT